MPTAPIDAVVASAQALIDAPAPSVVGGPMPTLPVPTGRVEFREEDDPSIPASTKKIRREIWQRLKDYAKEANLTEEQ